MLLLAAPPAIRAIPYTYRNVEIVGGGFVTGIIPHPKVRDLVYARTDIGGAYRWEPKTSRWTPLQDWLTRKDWNLYGVESLAIDPSDPNRVYLAAGTYTNGWAGNGAILRSNDRGKTWDRTDLPFKNGGNMPGRSMGERLVVDPNDGRTLFFATRLKGLQVSHDRGASWRGLAFDPQGEKAGIGWHWVLPDGKSGRPGSASRVVYGAVGTRVLRSRDGGSSWQTLSGGPKDLLAHQAKMADDGALVIVYSDQEGPNDITKGEVWRFDPKGDAWTDLTPERSEEGATLGYGGVAVRGKTILVSTLDRWKRGDTVFRSTDRGRTWTSLKETAIRDSSRSPYLNWDRKEAEFGHWIGDVEIDPFRPDRAWYVTGATIWGTDTLSAARSQWIPRAEGLEETAVTDLISPPEGANLISGLGDIGGFVHDDFRKSPAAGIWTNPVLVTTTDLDYAGLQPLIVARVGRGHGRLPEYAALSKDGGRTWNPLPRAVTGDVPGGSVAVSADARMIGWASEGLGPVFTVNGGKSWCSPSIPSGAGHLVADRVRPGVFTWVDWKTGRATIVRDSTAEIPTSEGLAFASDGASGLDLTEGERIVSVLGHEGHRWLPSKRGLLRSTDHGLTFRLVPGLDDVAQIGLGRAERMGGYPTLYAIGRIGSEEGVFRSVDEGRTWARVNDARSGFGTMQRIEGDPRVFGRFYLGTNGRGILVGEPNRIR